MKTTIWTAPDNQIHYSDGSFGFTVGRPRCIFNGDFPHLLRKGDQISIRKNESLYKIDYVSYDISEKSQEVHMGFIAPEEDYPTVDYR